MKQEIGFGLIDAKDGEVIDMGGGGPHNIHNAKIMAKAVARYLNDLLKLQENIRDLYESELIENKPIEGEPDDFDIADILSDETASLLEEGTDRLWYS
ncbi:hypothetical protein LCGC14_0805660 [marine sediment metagenome]|uniref:Uncharacterized protein n=1 Tax=marine sediment metagenome TaxID=412755 RepID=A0A0F9Q881_9ZZZZ